MSAIKVTVLDRDGNESTRTVDEAAKLSTIVDLSRDAVILNDVSVPSGRDPELRDGDEIEYIRKSHKAG